MHERFPRFFDFLIWPGIVLGEATLVLSSVAAGFLTLQKLGGGYSDLAVIGVASALACAIACPLSARIGARVGLRRLEVTGALLSIVAVLLMSQAQSVLHLALAMVVWGVGGALIWPNLEAELSRGHGGPPLRKRLSVFNTMWCTGTLIGPVLGFWIYPKDEVALSPEGRAAINMAFFVAAGLMSGTVLLMLLWRSRRPGPEEAAARSMGDTTTDPAKQRAFLLMAYVGNFMCLVVLSVLRQLYEKLATYQWAGENPAQRHYALLVGMAAMSVAMFVFLFFAHRWPYRLKRLVAWQVATVASLVLVALTANVILAAAGFAVIGLATAFIYSGSLFYSLEGKDVSSHMAGWHESVLCFGATSGLLLAGFIPAFLRWAGVTDDYWLLRSPYLLAAAVFALGIVLQLVIYYRHAPDFVKLQSAGDGGRS
jgi:MFS family permease